MDAENALSHGARRSLLITRAGQASRGPAIPIFPFFPGNGVRFARG